MIELSFCIPTYNRSSKCLKLVKEILSVDNENIEVIVSDNCSTDDTVALLGQINDKRLIVYQNEKNNGSLFNIYNSFTKAKGDYLYFTTDKDFINIKNLDAFLLFLTQNKNLACGYCAYHVKINTKNEIYSQGFQALSKVGYIGHHPSGYFFNREKLESTRYQVKLSNKNIVGEFFLDFILAELSLEGNAGIFNENFTIPQENSEAATDKSLSIKGMNTNAYYTPAERLKVTINQSAHINGLKLSTEEKKEMLIKVFIRGLLNATYGYKNILNNKSICEHYQLESQKIGFFKLLSIGLKFYFQYIQHTKSIRAENNLSILSFNFFIFKKFVEKILKRLKNAK